jgi:excinuclease ABC subunit B
MASIYEADYLTIPAVSDVEETYVSIKEIPLMIQKLKTEMKEAASHLEFERAAEIRDKVHRLEEMELKIG